MAMNMKTMIKDSYTLVTMLKRCVCMSACLFCICVLNPIVLTFLHNCIIHKPHNALMVHNDISNDGNAMRTNAKKRRVAEGDADGSCIACVLVCMQS